MGLSPKLIPEVVSGKWILPFAEGYKMRMVQKTDPSENTTIETINEMGNIKAVAQFRDPQYGTLAIEAMASDDFTLDALVMGLPPYNKQKITTFSSDKVTPVYVYSNVATRKRDRYNYSIYHGAFLAGALTTTAEVNGKGSRTYSGNCDLHITIADGAISQTNRRLKVQGNNFVLHSTDKLNPLPINVPGTYGVNCLNLRLIKTKLEKLSGDFITITDLTTSRRVGLGASDGDYTLKASGTGPYTITATGPDAFYNEMTYVTNTTITRNLIPGVELVFNSNLADNATVKIRITKQINGFLELKPEYVTTTGDVSIPLEDASKIDITQPSYQADIFCEDLYTAIIYVYDAKDLSNAGIYPNFASPTFEFVGLYENYIK